MVSILDHTPPFSHEKGLERASADVDYNLNADDREHGRHMLDLEGMEETVEINDSEMAVMV